MMQKTCIRILVLGAQEVGKSAVTVRFLTQRFIGEYSSQKDLLYCSQAQVSGCSVDVEILDTSRDQTECVPAEKLAWSSACAVVYSVASRPSLTAAAHCLRALRDASTSVPVLLLANKRDLEHARQVATREGRDLAGRFGCAAFAEVSAAEGGAALARAFAALVAEAAPGLRRKRSVASVSRIISAVFGSGQHQQEKKKRPSLSL